MTKSMARLLVVPGWRCSRPGVPTSNNPRRLHGPLNPNQLSLDIVDLAQLFTDLSIGAERGWIFSGIVLSTESALNNAVERQLVQAHG